jgi:cytoskeletal protein CcmA (bactofilin family)
MLLLSLALFMLVLALPAVPSMFEVRKPKDDGRLHIMEQYVRDPRFFGRSFRHKLAPFVNEARGNRYGRAELQMRTDEAVRWSPDLLIPALERLRGIGVGERVVVGHGAGIRDAYALEHLDVEHDVVARTLTSDATMHVGSAVQVLRWIDADGDIDVDSDTDLGLSASGGARVTLGERVRFERVWGAPVASHTAHREPYELSQQKATLVDATSIGDKQSLILYGPVRIAAGTAIPAHLKVHGPISIESGVRVGGNVIARGDVTLAEDVTVGGHIFAEGDIRLGPRSRVSRESVSKTVYATGAVLIANDVEIFGWVVSEAGGYTL